jgi:esterase/lipase superfamily enzyme
MVHFMVHFRCARPVLVFFLSCFAVRSTAQTPAMVAPQALTLQGSIQTPDGKPITGARVDIRNGSSEDAVLFDTSSDTDGNFAFLALPLLPGRYLVHASAVGFEAQDKLFEVKQQASNQALTLTLTLKPAPKERGPSSRYTLVRVFYATDRQAEIRKKEIQYLGIRSKDGMLAYGWCDVSIPETHTIAEIERPSVWKLEFHADPEKHIILQKVESEQEDRFLSDVSAMVSTSPDKDAFVFVHGYNESFESAAIRTAQLAYDFGFKGAPIFYSWPSKGSLLGYTADEANVDETVENLKQFLEDVANRTGATTVHLIAHSMGNRALLNAITALAVDSNFKNYAQFGTVVLAAPDVDRDVFIKQIAAIQKPQSKLTLYVSAKDQALEASHLLFHKEPRAGEGGSDSIVMEGLDTVDVSELSADALGHSYFADNRTVVRDLLEFLQGKIAPRPGLTKVPVGALAYWQMIPTN